MLSKIAVSLLTALLLHTIEQATAAPRRLEIAPRGSLGLPPNEVVRERNCATGCGGGG